MPFPWNEKEPTLPAVSSALNVKRDDIVSAVVVAAFATGSSASVPPPAQPTRADAQSARLSRARERRRVILDSNRPRLRRRLSLDWGQLVTPSLRVLAESGGIARGDRFPEPLRRLRKPCDGAPPYVLA